MIQRFEMHSAALLLEPEKSILICKSLGEGEGKRWVKKLPDVHGISSVLEDSHRYYISCDYEYNRRRVPCRKQGKRHNRVVYSRPFTSPRSLQGFPLPDIH